MEAQAQDEAQPGGQSRLVESGCGIDLWPLDGDGCLGEATEVSCQR